MKPRILLTTTSFQDTPGEHHKMLAATGWEVVTARGPLSEADTLALMGDFDGYICGDDMITQAVIDKALPRLKVISKYGIGVDKIDVKYLTSKEKFPFSSLPELITRPLPNTLSFFFSPSKRISISTPTPLAQAVGNVKQVASFSTRPSVSSAWDASAKKSPSALVLSA